MAQCLINGADVRAHVLEVLNSKSAYLQDGNQYTEILQEYAEEYADHIASQWAEAMYKYTHRADTSICGNFNDIRRDYENEHEGAHFADIVARADRNELTAEELKTAQNWALGWLWETFGTFGIYYNFDSMAGDLVYSWEEEDREQEAAEIAA